MPAAAARPVCPHPPFPIPHSRRRVPRAAQGFTLLEVLASLVLLTLLLLGVYSGVRTATRTVQQGTAATARLDQIRAAQQLLRRELAQALAIPIGRNASGDSLFFRGDAQSMSFVAPLPGYLGPLGPQLQTLRLVKGEHGDLKLQLQLALLPPDGGAPKPLGTPQLLLDHLREGRFEYRGINAKGQVTQWSPQWADGRLLPSLVRIALQPEGSYGWPRLETPLRIDPASGLQQGALSQRLQPMTPGTR